VVLRHDLVNKFIQSDEPLGGGGNQCGGKKKKIKKKPRLAKAFAGTAVIQKKTTVEFPKTLRESFQTLT